MPIVHVEGEVARATVAYARRHLQFEANECLFHLGDSRDQLASLAAIEAYRWARYIWLRTDIAQFAWSVDAE